MTDFIFLGSKISVDGDCSHEIKRFLFLERKVMPNQDSIWESRDSTLPTKAHLVKVMVFPLVMHGCESWTIKKAECWKIDYFELWCWRRLLSPLDCKEIKPVKLLRKRSKRLTHQNGRSQIQFSSVQSLSRVWLFATPWIPARQASLSITNSRSLLKLMPIESVMPSRHLILCRPLLLLPPIPPSIRVFSNESILRMSFSFNISPSNEY